MNLLEVDAKALFSRYGIPVPDGKVVTVRERRIPIAPPVVLKAQVPVGDRRRKGGIVFVDHAKAYPSAISQLFRQRIDGHVPDRVLVEPRVAAVAERYVSMSYDTAIRTPVLALGCDGGTGVGDASLTPIDPIFGLPEFAIREAIVKARFSLNRTLPTIIQRLWQLFQSEKALLVEVNPLFELPDGSYLAGDGKVILDDHVIRPDYRPFLELGGDIAVLASGGGASMINLDVLLKAGGRPANYVEYSGNPKAGVVAELTRRVLSRPGLRGLWVVGGTANFTDIYETMVGFVEGLRQVAPKPTYPMVIRRDGPRQQEAFAMLREVAAREGYTFHLYGPETPMARSAAIMVRLAYGKEQKDRTRRQDAPRFLRPAQRAGLRASRLARPAARRDTMPARRSEPARGIPGAA